MSSRAWRIVVTVACAVGLAACGNDPTATALGEPSEQPSVAQSPTPSPNRTNEPAEQPTREPSDDAVVIDVVISDRVVTPVGDRVGVDLGDAVQLVVTSDVAGEFHVHSSPESYEGFAAGSNPPIELEFARPGLIDIELHEPFEAPVVQLGVS